MQEKILSDKKNGMLVLIMGILLYAASIALIIFGAVYGMMPLMIIGILWMSLGWILFVGLRVLKPQEALVLTLFGKYIGTIREAGFYFVNPFCTAVNPAAKTKLSQSGDVNGAGSKQVLINTAEMATANAEIPSKRISLKIMTLNNNRQKINDCLGNPVEIGIAVMWRVVDTAKAVFNVDNYKEYLSLQCDSALRNIVRIYPYDVAPNVDTTGDGIADEGSLRGSSEVVAERIRQEEEDRLVNSAEQYDVTLPMDTDCGSYHPITLVQRELEEIFASMGFTIEDYREVVTDYNCFEALNIPKHHPARDMQDTYYLDNGQLLKTHTSAAQNTIMKKYGAPLRAIFPGRCFRNESTDASHENTFFQMEGIMIDKDISISNLIYFMKTMLSKVFKQDVQVRLRPGFFPFVEPGFELDISCLICGGTGCPSCKHSGWLELCPCGMIHPEVLKAGGIDPEQYTGFAFGLGMTRLAMMKYGVKDIRDLNSGSLTRLAQFTDDE